ncbi:MAG: hypothetical protein WCD13_14470 [Pseudolabrys sp.]
MNCAEILARGPVLRIGVATGGRNSGEAGRSIVSLATGRNADLANVPLR